MQIRRVSEILPRAAKLGRELRHSIEERRFNPTTSGLVLSFGAPIELHHLRPPSHCGQLVVRRKDHFIY